MVHSSSGFGGFFCHFTPYICVGEPRVLFGKTSVNWPIIILFQIQDDISKIHTNWSLLLGVKYFLNQNDILYQLWKHLVPHVMHIYYWGCKRRMNRPKLFSIVMDRKIKSRYLCRLRYNFWHKVTTKISQTKRCIGTGMAFFGQCHGWNRMPLQSDLTSLGKLQWRLSSSQLKSKVGVVYNMLAESLVETFL